MRELGAKLKSRQIGGNSVALQSHAAIAEIRDSLLETDACNDAMNQLILSDLDPRAWRAQAPGQRGSGRTIAAIFAHLHCTMKQAAVAHRKSAAQCLGMLSDALSAAPNRRVTKFSRGSWTRTWPAGGTMFAYMFAHEAQHRGQILMLAHQLGYRLLHELRAYGTGRNCGNKPGGPRGLGERKPVRRSEPHRRRKHKKSAPPRVSILPR
jgi:hypothetical protein